MNALFARWLPCLTLASWSGILLYFAQAPQWLEGVARHTFLFSGRIGSFLVPAFHPYVLLAGVVLLGMALVFLFVPADAECCSAQECAHPLSRQGSGKWLTFLVLLVPIAAAAVGTPDAFSKVAVKNRVMVTDASGLAQRKATPAPEVQSTVPPPLDLPLPSNGPPGSPAPTVAATDPAATPDYLKRTPEGYIEAEVLDMLYAAQDNLLRKDFEGKKVVLTAQLMPDPSNNPAAKRFRAVRMFMTCCAADARPVATLVEAKTLPELPEMTWVKVVGIATFPIEDGKRKAVIQAETVEKAAPPEDSMLY